MGSAWFFGVVAIAAGGAAACSAKDLSEFNAGGAAGAGASTSSGGSSGSAGQGGTGNAGATGGSGGATGGSGGATGGSGGATGGSGGATGGSGGATGGSGGATGGSGGATGGSGGATGDSGGATGGTGGCSSQTLTTAWMSPAEAQDEGPGGAWIFESHVDKSDNQRATSTIVGSGNTSVLQALDFGFQIPNTATILGIELSIERSASVGSAMKDLGVKLGLDGSAFSVTKEESQPWPTADAYTSYGSATDTWSIPGLSPFIVNSKKFDAHLTARCYEASACAPGVEARVDHMRMRITYKTTCN